MLCYIFLTTQRHDLCTGLASEGSRHGGQSWTEELIAQNAANSEREDEAPKFLSEEVEYPAVERKLRSWYYQWVSAKLSSRLLAKAGQENPCQSRSSTQLWSRSCNVGSPSGWLLSYMWPAGC